jgi:hypothetical protein
VSSRIRASAKPGLARRVIRLDLGPRWGVISIRPPQTCTAAEGQLPCRADSGPTGFKAPPSRYTDQAFARPGRLSPGVLGVGLRDESMCPQLNEIYRRVSPLVLTWAFGMFT